MSVVGEINVFTTRKNVMPAVLLIPLRHGRILVHVLDNVSPTNARVVSAEGDFAFLCAVRNDAHLRAAEVVVEKILEPHSRDEQEVPAIGTALFNIFPAAVASHLAVLFARQAKRLVKLLEELVQRELRRRLVRVV